MRLIGYYILVELEEIVMGALERDRGRRFQGADEVLNRLEAYLQQQAAAGAPPPAQRLARQLVELIGDGEASLAELLGPEGQSEIIGAGFEVDDEGAYEEEVATVKGRPSFSDLILPPPED